MAAFWPIGRVPLFIRLDIIAKCGQYGSLAIRCNACGTLATCHAGYQLDKVQRGEQPDDFRPMPSSGKGVEEIRVADDSGAYPVIYFARRTDAVYMLHAFQKKTQATQQRA